MPLSPRRHPWKLLLGEHELFVHAFIKECQGTDDPQSLPWGSNSGFLHWGLVLSHCDLQKSTEQSVTHKQLIVIQPSERGIPEAWSQFQCNWYAILSENWWLFFLCDPMCSSWMWWYMCWVVANSSIINHCIRILVSELALIRYHYQPQVWTKPI